MRRSAGAGGAWSERSGAKLNCDAEGPWGQCLIPSALDGCNIQRDDLPAKLQCASAVGADRLASRPCTVIAVIARDLFTWNPGSPLSAPAPSCSNLRGAVPGARTMSGLKPPADSCRGPSRESARRGRAWSSRRSLCQQHNFVHGVRIRRFLACKVKYLE